jgi:hypothetical protein
LFRGTVYLVVVAQLTISESFQQKNRRKVQRIDFYFGSLPIIGDIQVSGVESKPASDGRIKTSHFFRLNRLEMFWQGVI